MRSFFSYYGAKYTVAKYAGAPRRKIVIEPSREVIARYDAQKYPWESD
jgi:hypothetical protein